MEAVMDARALHRMSYGMYIVSSKCEDKCNGQVANSVFQVTSEPPQVVACINKQNLTHEYMSKSGVFAVSVLSQDTPFEFIGGFGFRCGRDVDKCGNCVRNTGVTGAPIIMDYAVAFLECEVVNSFDAGTHTMFVGRVVNSEVINDDEPMTYAYYRLVKGGKSPKTAPTFIKE
jgi:flavin reductase (DIM6/NTAB) family NADH-FMN oxidoreductase RutF